MKNGSNCYYINLSIFVIFISIIVSIYLILNRKIEEKEKVNFLKSQQLDFFQDKYSSLLFADTLRISNNEKFINTSFYLLNVEKDSILFLDLIRIQEKGTIFFYYNELNCHLCVDSELKIINEFIKKSNLKIVLLAKYKSMRDLYLFIRTNQLANIEIYNLRRNSLGLNIEKFNTPFYFTIDTSNIARNVFIPEKMFPDRSSLYLKTQLLN